MTDTDTNLFDVFAKLDVTIGKVGDNVKALQRETQRWRELQETPRFVRIHSTVTLNASGFAVAKFDNDGPDMGRMWYVRKLTIGGVTPSTAVAGRADLFVSTMDYRAFTTLAQCGTQDWMDSATTLPLVGTFAPGEIMLQYMEQFFVVISGGTGAQEVRIAGTVEDFQVGAYKSDWAL